MSYVKDSLMPGEKVLLTARIHAAVFLPAMAWFLLGVAVMVYALFWTNTHVFTTTRLSMETLLPATLLFVAALLALNGLATGLQALVMLLTTEFAVTNRRIIAKHGFLRRHTLEMLILKVESVAVRQSLLGRMLNFGTVMVTGTGGTKENFRAIVEPLGVRRKIYQVIEYETQAGRASAAEGKG